MTNGIPNSFVFDISTLLIINKLFFHTLTFTHTLIKLVLVPFDSCLKNTLRKLIFSTVHKLLFKNLGTVLSLILKSHKNGAVKQPS